MKLSLRFFFSGYVSSKQESDNYDKKR